MNVGVRVGKSFAKCGFMAAWSNVDFTGEKRERW